jgi:hypothetical protein
MVKTMRPAMRVIFSSTFLLLLLSIIFLYQSDDSNYLSFESHRNLVPRETLRYRRLQTTFSYNVKLPIALLYLNESIASQFESLDESIDVVSHFCRAINEQVSQTLLQTTLFLF